MILQDPDRRRLRLARAGFSATVLMLLFGCGIAPQQGPTETKVRLSELRETAERASQLSVLQREAYTRNTLLQFSGAESDYRETLRLARELFPTDPARASSLTLHLALNKSNLGQYESAEELFQRSRRIVSEIGAVSERAKPDLFYSQHLMNLKQYAEAEQVARDGTRLLSRMIVEALAAGGAPVIRTAFALRNDGTVLIDQESANAINARTDRDRGIEEGTRTLSELQRLELQRAHANYITARAIKAQGGGADRITPLLDSAEADMTDIPEAFGRWLRAELTSMRSDILIEQGLTDEAIARLDDAIALLRRYELNSRPEALLLFKLGEVLIETGQGSRGQSAFRDAVAIIKASDQGIEPAQATTVIEQLLAEMQSGDRSAAAELFEVMQKVRTSATAQTVAQLSARLSSGDSGRARLIRDVQNLERQVNILSARFDRLEADPDADLHIRRVTESKLVDTRSKLASNRAALKEVAPNYDQLLDATISLKDAQAALNDGEVMAIIQLGVDKGLVGVLTNLTFDAYEITLSEAEAERVVTEIRASIDGDFLLPFDMAGSHALFRQLFAPVSDKIVGAEHLVIVPSGPLTSMPFNTLMPEEYTEEIQIVDGAYFDYSAVPFLGKETPITTGVSISSFFLGREIAGSQATRPFLGFGDFRQFGNDIEAVRTIMADRGLPQSCEVSVQALGLLNELEGTREELAQVEAALNISDDDIILGKDFTDTNIKTLPLSDYRVLHFATHGLLAQDPECLPEPGLVTSLGPGGDTLLETSEIVGLNLDAELVVMSACDTSAGAGQGAEGLTGFRGAGGSYAAGGESLNGLARSFFYAGARNVMSTYWSVDDTATQQMMTGFYSAKAADPDVSIAEAMQRSQAEAIATGEFSHPFFWAPFAVFGDGARKLGLSTAG